MRHEQWAREAVRLHRRYQTEIVEAYRLCPWAERATQDGRVREAVFLQEGSDTLEPSLAAIDGWMSDPTVDVAFAIYPRLVLGRQGFHDFAARVRDAGHAPARARQRAVRLRGLSPEANPDTGDAERLIPFLRRTPESDAAVPARLGARRHPHRRVAGNPVPRHREPRSVLSGAAQPPLRERIAKANLATAERCGIAALGSTSTTSAATATRRTGRSRRRTQVAQATPAVTRCRPGSRRADEAGARGQSSGSDGGGALPWHGPCSN